jgi:hypothetical protein
MACSLSRPQCSEIQCRFGQARCDGGGRRYPVIGSADLAKGEKRKLKLIDSRPLSTGIVILRYAPAAAK